MSDAQPERQRTTGRAHGPRPRPAIAKVGRGQPSARCAETAPPEVLAGFAQFNRGEFFEQHETLEDAWIAETDPVRYLYQGILQVGVGLLHLQRGNLYGARRMMAKGLALLQPFRPRCLGVDVERFVAESLRCLAAVETLTPETLATFDTSLIPRVHLLDG
jgi:predicted metal-dependent hydrolase